MSDSTRLQPIRFALVGCGRISRKHVDAITALATAELVAVCDPKFAARALWLKPRLVPSGNAPDAPARFVATIAARLDTNGKVFRYVTPRMFIPRMLGELVGAGKRNPRPWEN